MTHSYFLKKVFFICISWTSIFPRYRGFGTYGPLNKHLSILRMGEKWLEIMQNTSCSIHIGQVRALSSAKIGKFIKYRMRGVVYFNVNCATLLILYENSPPPPSGDFD